MKSKSLTKKFASLVFVNPFSFNCCCLVLSGHHWHPSCGDCSWPVRCLRLVEVQAHNFIEQEGTFLNFLNLPTEANGHNGQNETSFLSLSLLQQGRHNRTSMGTVHVGLALLLIECPHLTKHTHSEKCERNKKTIERNLSGQVLSPSNIKTSVMSTQDTFFELMTTNFLNVHVVGFLAVFDPCSSCKKTVSWPYFNKTVTRPYGVR